MTVTLPRLLVLLGAVSVALTGCPGKDLEDTGTPPQPDDTDTSPGGGNGGAETGTALLFFYGDLNADQTGRFGLQLYQAKPLPEQLVSLCSIIGDVRAGSTLPSCEGCDFAFDLVVRNSSAEGERCRDLGWYNGSIDGYGGGWGWSRSYTYVGTEETYTMDNVVWYYFSSTSEPGWSPVAFSYDGQPLYGYADGDETHAEFSVDLNRAYYFYP